MSRASTTARRPSRVTEALDDLTRLVEPTGPFLTLPVLKRAFPNGFDHAVSAEVRAEMRQRLAPVTALAAARDEARRADGGRGGRRAPTDGEAERTAWLRWVLRDLLEYGARLREGDAVPGVLQHTVPEHGVLLRPDFALVGPPDEGAPAGRTRLLIEAYAAGTDFGKRVPGQRWTASPVERMAVLCRATGVELGLVTDAERFTLVWAPRGGSVATATWRASLWSEERGLFDAFVSLVGARRFFAVAADDTLEALLDESAKAQVEVTSQLGKQVLQAVELLVDAFSRANCESGDEFLESLGATNERAAADTVYAAAVTVMMRLVFLLCAEERRLFPVGDALYNGSYAVSTMLDGLREEADLYGEDPLERRTAAWHRLLATFRLVHDGVQHESLRIPAYGGSLFDPDRYPFLEGRRPDGDAAGTAPAVSDRSVMAILDALQYLSFRSETRRVSYQSLDVEQIGHVYEGLLDHGCRLVHEITLGLTGGSEPEVPLADVEKAARKGREALVAYVREVTGRSGGAGIVRDLDRPMDAETRRYLREACENNGALIKRVEPFVHLLRRDLRGLPVVFLEGAVCVTQTSSRRDSGTEYTTRELADEVVRYALEPLVYAPGPQDGAPREEWKLRTPAEILALRVCDPAVGSGAIIVAACRYLAARLEEAWTASGATRAEATGDADAQAIAALRAVMDRCVYGVDRNPMAVEMAKLSLWLVTMAKDRPFSFLDHAIQSGDSLLGLSSMQPLQALHWDASEGERIHRSLFFDYTSTLGPLVARAAELRARLTEISVLTVRDAEQKAAIFRESEAALQTLHVAADALTATTLFTAGQGADAYNERLTEVAPLIAEMAQLAVDVGDVAPVVARLRAATQEMLDAGRPASVPARVPFHWPLAFPEVFLVRDPSGFDALVGNPPFLGGQRITSRIGTDYRTFCLERIADGRKGSADLAAYFVLRTTQVAAPRSSIGLLSTNSIAQGETRPVALEHLLATGWTLFRAVKSRPWPGSATLEISQLWFARGWRPPSAVLDGRTVPEITASLDAASRVKGAPYRLAANKNRCIKGSEPNGSGFLVMPDEARELLRWEPASRAVLRPYLTGEDLNSSPSQQPSRWAINFGDLDEEAAARFTGCWNIVRDRVRPEREGKTAAWSERLVREWWRYWAPRTNLYESIGGLARCIAIAGTSRTLAPAFVPKDLVFANTVYVFGYDDDFHFGVLASGIHAAWVLKTSATMRTDIRYNPADCFETFPMPEGELRVAGAARRLDDLRLSYMRGEEAGLTATYNRVNDSQNETDSVRLLREAIRGLDTAVASCYGWSDIDLGHGFHETSQGIRFTLAKSARNEVLDRLLELNHARFAEEIRLGHHETRAKRGGTKPAPPLRRGALDQGDLLADFDAAPAAPAAPAARPPR